MKLLLTSNGITNDSIANALADLADNPLSRIKVAFIVTAQTSQGEPSDANNESDQFVQLTSRGIDYVIVDPPSETQWRKTLHSADVIMLAGGNTFQLLNKSRKCGLTDWLRDNANNKVYVGTSAGSILMTPNIGIASVDNGDENTPGITNLTGLGLVGFEVSPHTPEAVSISANLEYSKSIPNELLLMDNQTALKVLDNTMEIVSEGHWQWCRAGELINDSNALYA